MKKRSLFTGPSLLALVLVFQTPGCGGDDPYVPPPAPPSPYKYARCLGNTVHYATLNTASAGLTSPGTPGSRPHVAGEVLIKFAEGVTRTEAAARVPQWGARVLSDRLGAGRAWNRWVKAELPPGTGIESALEEYAGMPGVEIVQPNYIYRISSVPADPQYGQLWGMENTGQTINDPRGVTSGTPGMDMDLPAAWDEVTDCSSVRVAVIDTGINYDHQDLAANMWDGSGCPPGYDCPLHGYDFVGAGDNDPMDMNGHGTHVAGTIGAVANNGVGVAGVCWRAEIVAVRCMQSDGAGTSEDLSEGMRFAADAGAKVINMSLGGTGQDPLLLEAARHIRDAGAILVAAAGNTSSNSDVQFNHPGCINLDNIINVAAVDPRGQLASFSNFGAVSVDVAGPGTSILSPFAGRETVTGLGNEGSWSKNDGADWDFANCATTRVMSDPSNFCSGGLYLNDINDRTWTSMNLLAYDSAYLLFNLNLEVGQNDFFRAAYRTTGGDPFSGGNTLFSLENTTSEGEFLPYGMPLDNCTTVGCSFGFQLQTGPSGQARGVAIESSGQSLQLVGLVLEDDVYKYQQGTSMAAPNVAGVAALLWAQFPQASYLEIVLAVFDGTKPLGSLAGKTCTGGLVNARNSLDLLEVWMQ